MATKKKNETATALSRYFRDLLAGGIPEDVAQTIVIDAARTLHRPIGHDGVNPVI